MNDELFEQAKKELIPRINAMPVTDGAIVIIVSVESVDITGVNISDIDKIHAHSALLTDILNSLPLEAVSNLINHTKAIFSKTLLARMEEVLKKETNETDTDSTSVPRET